MRFENKRVLVSGAGSNGIGRAIASAFAREGATVVVHYHSKPQIAAELIAEIEHAGRRAIAIHAELRNPVAARQLVREAAERLGGLDIVVCAAATMLRKSALETSDPEWSEVLDVNLHAAFACATEAAKLMVAGGTPGRIILIGSALQERVAPDRAAYSASKGGLRQLARSLAYELAPRGITVNLIGPGVIITDMNRALHADPERARRRMQDVPMGRFGEPDDVVEAAMFLASPGAGYVTGNTVFCDGGMMLR